MDGIERKYVKETERGLMTIFGPVRVNRLGYKAKGTTSINPADKELNLPADYYSHQVRKLVAEEASKNAYDEVVKSLKKYSGAKVGKRQAEELVKEAAQDFEKYYEETEQTAGKGSILVISTDAKGIVMRKEDLKSKTRKEAEKQKDNKEKNLNKEEKSNRKRMAQVATVYTIKPYHREATSIVKELEVIKEVVKEIEKNPRPKPEEKRVWAGIERSAEQIIGQAIEEAKSRDPEKAKKWVALVDGNLHQLETLEQYAIKESLNLNIILDIIHVLGYLWAAAKVLCKENSEDTAEWVSKQLLLILQGQASIVASTLKNALSGTVGEIERLAVDKCADYLIKYSKYLCYDKYLAQGFPISTGVIEGACRHLIKDRMDLTGARWSLKGAESILRLRSLRSSNDFDDYWLFHLQQEFQRNYSHFSCSNF